MKQFILSLIAIFFFITVKAQMNSKAAFRVSIFDISANAFFVKHPNIKQVNITYKDNKLENLDIEKKSQNGLSDFEKSESYSLDFAGDLYFLKQKYPEINLEKTVKLVMYEIAGSKLADSTTTCYLTKRIQKDSIYYDFSYYTITGKIYPGPVKGGRAEFVGDIAELEEKFKNNYKKWKPISVTDSVLLFTAKIQKTGSINNLKLKSGTESLFTQKVKAFIEAEAIRWNPAHHTGRKVDYNVTLFVRVNNDESITFDYL